MLPDFRRDFQPAIGESLFRSQRISARTASSDCRPWRHHVDAPADSCNPLRARRPSRQLNPLKENRWSCGAPWTAAPSAHLHLCARNRLRQPQLLPGLRHTALAHDGPEVEQMMGVQPVHVASSDSKNLWISLQISICLYRCHPVRLTNSASILIRMMSGSSSMVGAPGGTYGHMESHR